MKIGKRVFFTLLVIIVIISGSILYYYWPRGENEEKTYPWLFTGAYGVYIGSTTFRAGGRIINVISTIRISVFDTNNTHYKLFMQFSYEVPETGEMRTYNNASWIPVSHPVFFIIKGFKYIESYNTVVSTSRYGIRNCTVNVYMSTLNNMSIVKVYIDTSINWPIGYELINYLTPSNTSGLFLNLTNTNIGI